MSTITQPAKELLEAWGDVVATNDSGWLQDCDGGYASTLTRYQRPATTLYDRTDGRFLPIYQTEFDLAVIRAMGRTLAQVSPALVGAVRSMCNYTIGEGFTFTANRDDTAELSPSKSQKLFDAVQREINTLLDDMDFELEPPVVVEAGDIAIAYARWQLRGTAANGDPVEMAGRSGDVFRRQPDGRWLVVIDNAFGKA